MVKQDTIYRKINTLFVTSKIENCPMNVLEAKIMGYQQFLYRMVFKK